MKKELYFYRASVVKCQDGDSVIVEAMLGFDAKITLATRLYGIDTPETRMVSGGSADLKKLGLLAKTFLTSLLADEEEITIRTHKKGKYGRYLAELFIDGDKSSVNEFMVQERMAVRYYGQNKQEVLEEHLANVAWHKEQGTI
tara:strand:- start:850 stop:1278 length:429 start_codon:yes stop_codon:yes gene_type:complete